jgi:hypothetical protein
MQWTSDVLYFFLLVFEIFISKNSNSRRKTVQEMPFFKLKNVGNHIDCTTDTLANTCNLGDSLTVLLELTIHTEKMPE